MNIEFCHPQRIGDASYDNHQAERKRILDSLTYRAKFMTDMFNELEGTFLFRAFVFLKFKVEIRMIVRR